MERGISPRVGGTASLGTSLKHWGAVYADEIYVGDNEISVGAGDAVNVKVYGAKGDGTTDDTAAIQAALNASDGTVVFPNGIYVVSDTLTISGITAQTELAGSLDKRRIVDLNGSRIVWAGNNGEKPVIKINGTKITLTNGIISGAPDTTHRATIGVFVESGYNNTISNLVIVGYTVAGLRIGDSEHTGSFATVVDNLQITANGSINSWTDDGPAGIDILGGADNKFSNIVSLRNKRHVWLHVGGNQFTNCHFCSIPKDTADHSLLALPETAGVWYSLNAPTSWAQDVFVNCYFDSMKYVIYDDEAHSHMTQIIGSFYFYPTKYLDTENGAFEGYMIGGATGSARNVIHVTNFSVVADYVKFFSGLECRSTHHRLSYEDYVKNIYGREGFAYPWLAKYKVNNNEPVCLSYSTSTIDAESTYCIGGLLFNGSNNNIHFSVDFNHIALGHISADVRYYNGAFVCSNVKNDNSDNSMPALSIHEPITVAMNGVDLNFVPICITNRKTTAITGGYTCSVYTNNKDVGIYLVHIISNSFKLESMAANNGITINTTPAVTIIPQTVKYVNAVSTVPGEDRSSGTVTLNTITTPGVYQVYCDSNTVGAPETGYGVLEVFALPSRPNAATFSKILQRLTIDDGATYTRALKGENLATITAWIALAPAT